MDSPVTEVGNHKCWKKKATENQSMKELRQSDARKKNKEKTHFFPHVDTHRLIIAAAVLSQIKIFRPIPYLHKCIIPTWNNKFSSLPKQWKGPEQITPQLKK